MSRRLEQPESDHIHSPRLHAPLQATKENASAVPTVSDPEDIRQPMAGAVQFDGRKCVLVHYCVMRLCGCLFV
ncbi:hypothetical protein Ddc_14509 [Ditylenchus destructor]|nr:hypothetical protein Ddc_14509 [Ditylenchus destructor]